MNQPRNPYSAPGSEGTSAQLVPFATIPFYRRNSIASALLLVALFLAFVGPMVLGTVVAAAGPIVGSLLSLLLGAPLLVVCVVVLTGDVYYEAYDAQGQLKKWGVANKVVAALIVLGWGYSIVSSFLG